MNPKHYSELVNLKIYCLISGEYVYVGKTKSPALGSTFSRHIHGYYAATDAYFAPEGANRPKLYLLKHGPMTQAVGYKYVLAFIRLFRENGFFVINHEKSIAQAESMDAVTENLYIQISEIPIERLLELSYIPKPSQRIDKEVTPVEKPVEDEKELLEERLSVRLTEAEKLQFIHFAKKMNLSQRDCLVYLLNIQKEKIAVAHDCDLETYIPRVISSYEKKLAAKDAEIERLRNQVLARDASVSLQRKRIAFIKEGVGRFFQMANVTENGLPLLRDKYSRAVRGVPKEQQYSYPEEEGFIIFRPMLILWGKKSPTCFVLGLDENGCKIKVRQYEKYHKVGPSLVSGRFGCENTEWIIGIERAKDGGMDVVVSLPLDVLSEKPKHPAGDTNQKRLLDDLIEEAESQRFKY